MIQIPDDGTPESTFALLRDPYEFISKQCQRYHTNLFQTRLRLRKTICMTGYEAAELFYNPQRFKRRGVLPSLVKKTLFGEGGAQGLDDEAHRHRKQMFLLLMTPERIRHLADTTENQWRVYAHK